MLGSPVSQQSDLCCGLVLSCEDGMEAMSVKSKFAKIIDC